LTLQRRLDEKFVIFLRRKMSLLALFDRRPDVSLCPLPRYCGSVSLSGEPQQQQTATQAGYPATVQEALSGNRWGRVLSQASQASDDKVARMPRQRVLNFHLVNGRTRSDKLAADGKRERATVLVCHLAGNRPLLKLLRT